MPSTNRIYGGEKIFLTPEERADMLRGASDQFMTDITYLPRYLQEFIARPTPLTPGEMRNPQQGTLESLRADNSQWDEFQQGQPSAYQQGRSLGTAGAVVADPLNYMAQAVPVVKGVGRLANMLAREATTPQGLKVIKNALLNERGSIPINLPPQEWSRLGSKERLQYYDPDALRSNPYDLYHFDRQELVNLKNIAEEEAYRESYPFAFISNNPLDEERVFYRAGKPPESNRSYNYLDQRPESGVSVYAHPDEVNAFFAGRPLYYGKGRQVGWGSDGEPVVIPTSEWKKK